MEEEVLQQLRDAIEKELGYALNTPYDFNMASKAIVAKTERSISSTTLMRGWGYVRENVHMSFYNLSTLAMFIGYFDIKDFAAHHQENCRERTGKGIVKKKMMAGQGIWYTGHSHSSHFFRIFATQ